MAGNIFVLVLVGVSAVYAGGSLERARRAGQDAKMVRRRVASLRATRSKEYLHALMIIGGFLLLFFMIARWG